MEPNTFLPLIAGNSSDHLPPKDRSASSLAARVHGVVDNSSKTSFTSAARRTSTVTFTWQPPENSFKAQEISGVRKTARAEHRENSIECNVEAEIQQLRDENFTFRHEIDSLRAKLAEKMRGHSKVVAGGQYRAASVSGVAEVSLKPNTIVCTKCSTARSKEIEASYNHKKALATTAELQAYVDKIESARQRLWEERSLHVHEIANLRDKIAEKVEMCALTEAKCIELKLELEKASTKVYPHPILEKEYVHNATQYTLEQSCDEIASLKEEVAYLVQQLEESQQKGKIDSQNLEDYQMEMKLEREQRHDETRLWREEMAEHKQQMLELERVKQATILDLELSHENELRIIRTTNQELCRDLEAKETEIHFLYQQHKAETRLRTLLADQTPIKTEFSTMKRHV